MGKLGKIDSIELDLQVADDGLWQANLVIYCFGMNDKQIPLAKRRMSGRDLPTILADMATYVGEMQTYVDTLYEPKSVHEILKGGK